MASIVYSKSFLKAAKALPKPIQEKLADLLLLAEVSPFNHLLHTKPLSGKLKGFYSFRINRDWRVMFKIVDSNSMFLIEVAERKDIYK